MGLIDNIAKVRIQKERETLLIDLKSQLANIYRPNDYLETVRVFSLSLTERIAMYVRPAERELNRERYENYFEDTTCLLNRYHHGSYETAFNWNFDIINICLNRPTPLYAY